MENPLRLLAVFQFSMPERDLRLLGGLFLIAVLFGLFTIRKKLLTVGGAVLAGTTGLWVCYFAGFFYILPLMVHFLSSSLISRIFGRSSLTSDEKDGKARDAIQVFCNGGIYMLLSTFLHSNGQLNEVMLIAMASSIAVSASDTWASEIGSGLNGTVIDLLTFKVVPPGISGGISFWGTLAGLAGAGCIALLFLLNGISGFATCVITSAGFAGMLLDSLIGAFFQKKYLQKATGILSDRMLEDSVLISGLGWMSNDLVNLISNGVIVLGLAICYHFS